MTKMDRLTLRIPPALHEELARLARANRRSLNAELVVRLERSVEGENA